jgi:hypothetical protein
MGRILFLHYGKSCPEHSSPEAEGPWLPQLADGGDIIIAPKLFQYDGMPLGQLQKRSFQEQMGQTNSVHDHDIAVPLHKSGFPWLQRFHKFVFN